MEHTNFEIVRAQAEDAAALLDYLKIVGGETDNLSFGAEGVPLDVEAEKAYLGVQAQSQDNIQLLAKANGEIIGTASLNRKQRRMGHRAEFGISLKKAWWGCGAASALAVQTAGSEKKGPPAGLSVAQGDRGVRQPPPYGSF